MSGLRWPPDTDAWIRFATGMTGVAVAGGLFPTTKEPVRADLGLVAGILGGELAGRGIVSVRRHSRGGE